MRLAIYGGTFDPIHDAHLAVARAAIARRCLDRVLIVPAACPPHKGGPAASYEDRLRMVELACAGDSRLAPSDLERERRSSYSIDTIERVRATLAPEDELYFLIGADAFAEVGTWHRWRDVIAAVNFIVASRPGHDFAIPPGARVTRLDTLALETSSTDIRRRLARGETVAGVPPEVFEYIAAHNLYQRC